MSGVVSTEEVVKMKLSNRMGGLLAVALVAAGVGTAEAQPRPLDERTQLLELAHRVVVEEAIDVLPKQLKNFYKDHRMEIPSQALVTKRRSGSAGEATTEMG